MPHSYGADFSGVGLRGPRTLGQQDRDQREPGAERDHDEDGEPALHR